MVIRRSWLLLLALVLTGAAWAGDSWPTPIPPEVWKLSEADGQGKGAVIVERSMIFEGLSWRFSYRIRILNEVGKGATSVLTFGENIRDLNGRTVLRSGEVIPLDPKKDVLERTTAAGASWRRKEFVAVPPGVTSDCVVDVSWRVPRTAGDYYWFRTTSFPLASAYPIAKEVVSIPTLFAYSWSLSGGDLEPVISGTNPKLMTYLNVPAVPEVPYTPEPARNLPRLWFFLTPENIRRANRKTEAEFWDCAGKDYFKGLFDEVDSGRHYRAWREPVLKDLPPSRQAAALELALRMNSLIRNSDRPTFAEVAALDKSAAQERIDSRDLNQTVKTGRTNDWGMVFLYLTLLKDAKIPSRLLFVADRDTMIMDPRRKDVSQWTDMLIGVPEPGKPTVWVDPAMRFASPGLISGDYQATRGLCVDSDTWKTEWITVPVQSEKFNAFRFISRLEIAEDEVQFKLEAGFNGLPEHAERRRFMALEASAQEKELRKQLEQRDRRVKVTKAVVEHAVDPRKNISWRAEGTVETEGGRRLTVQPFPCAPWPLHVPDSWPEKRTDLIVLPNLGTSGYGATFKIPAGYRLLNSEGLEEGNHFGTVSWQQRTTQGPDGPVGNVVIQVTVSEMVAGPEHYQDLKDFASWVREAMNRLVVLEKL